MDVGYDDYNRLTSVSAGTSTYTRGYDYDGDGHRVKQANSAGTVFYLWSSVLNQPVVELTSGGVYRAYVYSPSGQMLALQSYDANFYWVHADHLGSGRKLTNTSGNVIYRSEMDPHGQMVYEWASGGATYLNSHKFTGYERDWATNLDNAKARTYHHNRARFMQPDPLGLGAADVTNPQSLNLYSYVGNDPVNYVDPNGLYRCVYPFCGGPPPDIPDFRGADWGGVVDWLRRGSWDPGDDVIIYDGGDPQKRTDRKPPTTPDPCPPEKRRFFNWLDDQLGKMAKDLGTTKTLMLTLAAKEGGWTKGDLDHNQPLNNPFGVNTINNKGQAAGNVAYPSLDAAIQYWKQRFGERVQGTQTAEAFINGLERPSKGQPYNANIEGYTREFLRVHNTMLKYMELCGINK